MPTPARRAFDPEAEWAFGELLFGLDRLCDTDGRPVAERRAPSDVKVGVPIVLKPCPYADARQGQPMNVSALAQLTRALPSVRASVEAFHRHPDVPSGTWPGMLGAVLDQLAGPALVALDARGAEVLVPADVSAGHKVAAGFYGVLWRLLRDDACAPLTPGVESFVGYVERDGGLIGASEVCAGPMNLIRSATRFFLDGAEGEDSGPVADSRRVACIDALATQVRLAVAWRLFDEAVEDAWFFGAQRIRVEPRNTFVARRFDGRREERRHVSATLSNVLRAMPALPDDVHARFTELLARAYATEGEAPPALDELFRLQEGGFRFEPEASRQLSLHLAPYVDVYLAFVDVSLECERRLRHALELPTSDRIRVAGLPMTRPRALDWFEVALGHELRWAPSGPVELHNHRRTTDLRPHLGASA
ncbi:MAG: hypothetical protein H6721_00720 [Sandaracinus sp.]|nr:hypothetical protein [Sandaracinus sp.]MCB9630667.1 hypothetical protein [Sandaracinus sp.]